MGGRERVAVAVVDGAVLGEELGRSVPHVVGVGKAEVDEKRFAVLPFSAVFEVGEDLPGVPGASGFLRPATLGGVVADGELLVGSFVAVAAFARAHGFVAGSIEDRGHRVLFEVWRTEPLLDGAAGVGQVPDRAAAHHHVAGGGCRPRRRRSPCGGRRRRPFPRPRADSGSGCRAATSHRRP